MTVFKCDKCGKEIPIIKKKNSIGIEIEVLDTGKVRSAEWRIDKLFDDFDLCKSCAEVLSVQADNLFLRLRLSCQNQEMKEEWVDIKQKATVI